MPSHAARRRYSKPPIEEALVEFQFAPTQTPMQAVVGPLHERLHDDYSQDPRNQTLLQADIHAPAGKSANVTLTESVPRVQLLDETGKKLLSLGQDVVSVHTLRPYEGWEQFKPRIERGLRAYATLSNATQVTRLGVRYINRLELVGHGTVVQLEEFFTTPPGVAVGMPAELASFLNRADYVLDDVTRIVVTFASVPAPNTPTMLLDIDVVWQSTQPIDIETALTTMDALHVREGVAFESLITDKTRETFK